MALPLIGLGAIAVGAGLNFMGGRKAKKQQAAAQRRWERERRKLLEEQAADIFDAQQQEQRGLSEYMGGLRTALVAPPSAAPVTQAGDATGVLADRDAAWLAARMGAIDEMAPVDNAALAAQQTGMDDISLQRELEGQEFTSQLPARIAAPARRRLRHRISRDMAENDARLGRFRPSNAVANLQLLGGGLQTAGNLGIQWAGSRIPSLGGGNDNVV